MMVHGVKKPTVILGRVFLAVAWVILIVMGWSLAMFLLLTGADWDDGLVVALAVTITVAGLFAVGGVLSTIWRPIRAAGRSTDHRRDSALPFMLTPDQRRILRRQTSLGSQFLANEFSSDRRYLVRAEGAGLWGAPETSWPPAAELEAGAEVTATASHLNLVRIGVGPDFEIWTKESALTPR